MKRIPKKSIITRPLEKGVEYSIDVKRFSKWNPEYKAFLEKEGVNPDNMKLAVYFIPNSQLVPKEKQAAFDENGLPKAKYCVGGGFSFDYKAAQPGIFYVIEKNTGKFIATKSMVTGEKFQESIDPTDGNLMKKFAALGIDTDDMEFSFYFIPSGITASETSKD